MLRILIFLIIVVLIVISVGGYIATSAGWLSDDLASLYSKNFSFVTSLASVVGLLAFASSRKIKSTDFEKEELEKLQSLMKAAQDLESLQTNKSHTEKQILELERRRTLMELSVQKAGLVLFYRSQLERYEPKILKKIDGDEELRLAVKECLEARARLESLDEDINKDENVELIRSILDNRDLSGRRHTDDPFLLAADFIMKSVGKLMRI